MQFLNLQQLPPNAQRPLFMSPTVAAANGSNYCQSPTTIGEIPLSTSTEAPFSTGATSSAEVPFSTLSQDNGMLDTAVGAIVSILVVCTVVLLVAVLLPILIMAWKSNK